MSQQRLTAHAHRQYKPGMLLHLDYPIGTDRKFTYFMWHHLDCYCSTPYSIHLVLSLRKRTLSNSNDQIWPTYILQYNILITQINCAFYVYSIFITHPAGTTRPWGTPLPRKLMRIADTTNEIPTVSTLSRFSIS